MNRPDTTDLAIDRWRRLGSRLKELRALASQHPAFLALSLVYEAESLYEDLDRSLLRRALEETH